MSEKPEALQLADTLEKDPLAGWQAAATELRRQHAEIEQLREQNATLDATCMKLDMVRDELLEHLEAEKSVRGADVRRIAELTTQRDELLEALRQIVEQHGQWNNGIWAANIARAAIAKATGGTK